MEPLARRRSRTLPMSNCEYFASRTPRATFSKSQKTARLRASGVSGIRRRNLGLLASVEPGLQALEIQVNHRRNVQGKHLREQQPADDGEAERHARAAAG